MFDFDLTNAEILVVCWENPGPKKADRKHSNLNELPAVRQYFAYLAKRKKANPSKSETVKATEVAA